MQTYIFRYVIPKPTKMAANSLGWQENMDISQCLSTKIPSSVNAISLKNELKKRNKVHRQHMNVTCHWKALFAPRGVCGLRHMRTVCAVDVQRPAGPESSLNALSTW